MSKISSEAGKSVTRAQAKKLAEDVLADFRELKGFANAHVSDIRPMYDLNGRDVMYYEVKFSSPQLKDNGYAIISATQADLPVVQFSETGRTHYERLRELTTHEDFRMVRFGPMYITAETRKGKLLAEIGERPALVPSELQVHFREEVKKGSALARLPKKLRTDLTRFREEAEASDYVTYKLRFRQPDRNTAAIREAWKKATKPKSNPGCSYDHFQADGYDNHAYYLQIDPNTPPNDTLHASGCGPTAWMNIFGWHDLNWRPDILSGMHTINDDYIKQLTMDLHDYLGTIWMFGQGFTWPGDIKKGHDFARSHLDHDCDHWYRVDWWNTDEDWVFEVARSMARARRPFIVGYYQDWHYAIGHGILECKTHGWKKHSWLNIYPAWSEDDNQDMWIPKGTIFGVYGVYNFSCIPCVANTNPSSTELHRSTCIWVTKMTSQHKKAYACIREGLDDGFDGCAFCLPKYHTR